MHFTVIIFLHACLFLEEIEKLEVEEFAQEPVFSDLKALETNHELETPCQKIYQRACNKLCVLPSTTVYEHLPYSQLFLSHSGLGPDEAKAISIAIVVRMLFILSISINSLLICINDKT